MRQSKRPRYNKYERENINYDVTYNISPMKYDKTR